MTSNKTIDKHDKIQTLLEKGELHDAISSLSGFLSDQPDSQLRDLLKHQEETYKYLLHYFIEGYSDDSRNRMLADITSTLHYINDSIRRNEVLIDSSDIYSSTLRFERVRKATLSSRLKELKDTWSLSSLAIEAGGDVETIRKYDEALASCFAYIWTMYGSSSDDYELLLDAMKDPDLPFAFKAQAISALMLGNLSYFDRKGLNTLLDIFDADLSQRLSARALVAIVLVVASNPKRVMLDPRLKARLELWLDSIVIYRQLREVLMTLIRAHDTQRISSKMQNEVLPELMKLRPEILKKMRKLSENPDVEKLEENPEWEEIVNKNGLADKLKELTEIQLDGGDVMMLAFSNLKSFPFFNLVANWFLPFSSTHHDVSPLVAGSGNLFSELLDAEGVMCDSDKYSFIFSLANMPAAQREMVNSQMAAQMSQLKEALADRSMKSTLPEFDQETTRFVRDIYRFFKLFRKKTDFPDPFATPIDFVSLPVIGELISDVEIMNLVGEFYFKRGYYKEALPILLRLSREENNNHLIYEKIGYCYNALGNIVDALEWYGKAELFNPESLWLIKKIAVCHKLLNNYDASAVYYLKALEKDPENYNLLMNAGHALLESGKIKEALAKFYHADYLNPEKISTWRAIAWTELLSGNLNKSLENYKRILDQPNCTATDNLNLGHVYLLLKDYKNAVNSYKKSTFYEGYGIGKLEEDMRDDRKVLLDAGVYEAELNLILERVKYEL